jgi:predicted ATP-grasp superfamily ATP-dependent carboligase
VGEKESRVTRAKFEVVRHEQALGRVRDPETGGYRTGTWHTVVLQAVVTGSSENEQFYAATPSGEIRVAMVSAAAARQFEIGAAFYVDFTPAE